MKQRQLRLGDVLDDYCPRERRLTNHVVVAMIGDDVKQTRCTTCEAEHEYKQARLPRQRRKSEPAALYSQVLASAAPKKVAHDPSMTPKPQPPVVPVPAPAAPKEAVRTDSPAAPSPADDGAEVQPAADQHRAPGHEDGPVHRPLIRAQLPRQEQGQGPSRPVPDFTIRQPGGRPGRFRPRHQHGGGSRSGFPKGNVSGGSLRGTPRQFGGRPPTTPNAAKHQGQGRKRSK